MFGYMNGFGEALDALEMTRDEFGQRLTLCSCRHFYITQRLLKGTDIHLLCRNCGTSIQQVERHYSHVLPRMRIEELIR